MQKNIISLFWELTKPIWLQRNLALLFPVLAVLINAIAAPYILSLFLDRLQDGGVTLDNSWNLIAMYAALIFVGEVFMWRLALYFTWTFEIKGMRSAYMRIFEHLSNQSVDFHANRFGGSLVSQSSKLLSSFERFWDMLIWDITPMISTVIGSIVVLAYLGMWQYSVFLVIYSIVFAIIVYFGSKFLHKRNRDEAEKSNATSGYLADIVTNIHTVKAFGRERHEMRAAKKYIDRWHTSSSHLKWGVIWATSSFSTMYAIGAVGALLFAVLGAQYGIASVGTVYLVFVYALNINRQLWEFNNVTRTYSRVIGDAHEMTTVLNLAPSIVDTTTKRLKVERGDVEFKNLHFSYEKREGYRVFTKFNLSIPAGQRVGLVGHSGSGKTTLTKLLLRFADVEDGEIRIDGQDITSVTQASLHQNIAYVAQEPLLFHRSLAENIAYAKPDATLDQIKDAANKAHATEFIDTLPDGYETVVGERGLKLSGGQRQRIAIARAILKDAPILVLDEATSALDSESERLIQASLNTLMHGRTSIVIAHRLSTIAKLDRIIVLENGQIVEDGSHEQLLKQNGSYARLWRHQSGGFIEE